MSLPTSKTRTSPKMWIWVVAAAVLAALAILVIVLTLPKGPGPSATVEKFLQAISAQDADAAGRLVDETDERVALALKNLPAATAPISDVKVDQVDEWPEAVDGISTAQVPYTFAVGGEPVSGELAVTRSNDGVRVSGADAFTGLATMPSMDGLQAGIKGVDSAGAAISLFPGVYAVDKPEVPFPFAIQEDEVAVTPGASVGIAVQKDDAAVEKLIASLNIEAEQAAVATAQEAAASGEIPMDGLQVGTHAGQNLQYSKIRLYSQPSYADGAVRFRYAVTYDGDKWTGSLSYEWITMQAIADVTVTYDIDSTGTPGKASTEVDTTEFGWAQRD